MKDEDDKMRMRTTMSEGSSGVVRDMWSIRPHGSCTDHGVWVSKG